MSGRAPVFRCEVHREEGRARVAAIGELDLLNAGAFDQVVREELGRGPVLLDLARLEFMDSSGVRVLDRLLRDAERDGRRLVVAGELTRGVRQLLQLTGMLDVLPIEAGATEERR